MAEIKRRGPAPAAMTLVVTAGFLCVFFLAFPAAAQNSPAIPLYAMDASGETYYPPGFWRYSLETDVQRYILNLPQDDDAFIGMPERDTSKNYGKLT